MPKKQKVLVIVGPTSSGKSALAVELARKFGGEVISADSRQVYRGLDIGTGKITKREMRGIRHHLLDVVSPKKTFTAHDFLVRGRKVIATTLRRGLLPIIAGGTGFYIDTLMGRVTLPNVPANPKLRAQLEKKTATELLALLKKRNPHRAKTIEPYNKRRLIRAVEIAEMFGAVSRNNDLRSRYGNINDFVNRYKVLWIGVSPKMKMLERQITIRLFARISRGMVAEAKRLHTRGLSYKRMEALGLEYRSLARLLQGKVSRREFEEEIFREIRRYAKRQMTYWRRNKEITWFNPNRKSNILKHVKRWIRS